MKRYAHGALDNSQCIVCVFLQLSYDKRVKVVFQDKAWCDEKVMKDWINQQWKPACKGPMLLILDVHKAQQTSNIAHLFDVTKTNTVYMFHLVDMTH